MTENLISVKEFAEGNGLLRQTVFKVLKRLGIEPSKSRGGSQNRRQTISYITEHEARSVLEALASNRNFQNEQDGEETKVPGAALYDIGVFYLLRLEPEHDPKRSRLGSRAIFTNACDNFGVLHLTPKWSRHGPVGGFGRKLQ